MQSDKRIYTNVTRDKLVEEGDPEAAFLVATPGGDVPAEFVHLYEEYSKPKVRPVEPVVADPDAKAVEGPPENKAVAQAGKK